MKREEKHRTVWTLYQAGRAKRHIARLLDMDPKTVRRIIQAQGVAAQKVRKDKSVLDEDLLRTVHDRCEGYAQRTWEVLRDEHGIPLGYSTLTQRLRDLHLGTRPSPRSDHVPDMPGQEMQHDTSDFQVTLGGQRRKLICSGLYLRYSKMRYIKFYRRFDRFIMKCFFDEALRHFGYTARVCIIDNTSLARWYGTGSKMVPVPEMVSFAAGYGFCWVAHEVGHSDRKAGTERNFHTVATNFLPGRDFFTLEDLNRQAFEWATGRYAKRPQAKTGLIPLEAFEYEKASLVKLPEFVPAPYRPQRRGVDVYGYVAFGANYYWVPRYSRTQQLIRGVEVLEYAQRIDLYHNTQQIASYPLPPDGVKNQSYPPKGSHSPHQPKNRKKPSGAEEKKLREMGEAVSRYVDFVLSEGSRIHYKHKFIRQLLDLSRKLSGGVFRACVQRALRYQVNNIDVVANIATKLLHRGGSSRPDPVLRGDYTNRQSYQTALFNDEAPLPSLNPPPEGGDPEPLESC